MSEMSMFLSCVPKTLMKQLLFLQSVEIEIPLVLGRGRIQWARNVLCKKYKASTFKGAHKPNKPGRQSNTARKTLPWLFSPSLRCSSLTRSSYWEQQQSFWYFWWLWACQGNVADPAQFEPMAPSHDWYLQRKVEEYDWLLKWKNLIQSRTKAPPHDPFQTWCLSCTTTFVESTAGPLNRKGLEPERARTEQSSPLIAHEHVCLYAPWLRKGPTSFQNNKRGRKSLSQNSWKGGDNAKHLETKFITTCRWVSKQRNHTQPSYFDATSTHLFLKRRKKPPGHRNARNSKISSAAALFSQQRLSVLQNGTRLEHVSN